MAVDSVAGGTGIAVSSAIGDVTIDFDPPPGTSLPGNPTLVNVVSTALGVTSQRIASVAYVRAVAPPAGGAANQVLAKVDATNFNYAWINQTGGPGGPVAAEDVSVAPAALIPVAITDVQEALVDIYDRGVFIADGGLGPGPMDNGWVIGSPAGGAMGPGTLNVENGIYIGGDLIEFLPDDGAANTVLTKASNAPGDIVWRLPSIPSVPTAQLLGGDASGLTAVSLGAGLDLTSGVLTATATDGGGAVAGFAPSIGWTSGTDLNNVSFFLNNTDRTLTIVRIEGVVEVPNGGAAEVLVYKAGDGDALASGTPVHTSYFDANLTPAYTTQELTPLTNETLAPGQRLGLQTRNMGPPGWDNSVGSITVYLEYGSGFVPSISWTAETDPNNVSFFLNNTGRTLTIAQIEGVVEVPNGSAAEIRIVKANNGQSLATQGVQVHTAPNLNANAPGNSIQELTLQPGQQTLPAGWRLGILTANVDPAGWVNSIGSITVYLV